MIFDGDRDKASEEILNFVPARGLANPNNSLIKSQRGTISSQEGVAKKSNRTLHLL